MLAKLLSFPKVREQSSLLQMQPCVNASSNDPGNTRMTRQWMGIDQRPHAEHLLQQLGGEHVCGRTDGHQTAVIQHAETVAEGCGQVEVMEAGQCGQAQRLDLAEQFELRR